jgi:hydroxymethylglutaryl-CoA lyase
MKDFPSRVVVVEVGPRDGLQSEAVVLETEEKVELIRGLYEAGVREVEFSSFVRGDRVPQLRDAEAVFERIRGWGGVRWMALIGNERGYERAVQAGVKVVRWTVLASETFNRKNFNRGVADSCQELRHVARRAERDGIEVVGTVGASFGCPYEGEVPVERVVRLAQELAEAGVREVVLADTTGLATPRQVEEVIAALQRRVPGIELGCHFHNTRNAGLANVMAALGLGVRRFDAGVGGIGGCPFAPQAAGNIATEDLVHMLNGMGIETGIRLERLIAVAQWLERRLGHPLPGQVMKAGPGLFALPRGLEVGL